MRTFTFTACVIYCGDWDFRNEGRYEVIESVEGFKYPLKIVLDVQNDMITVITNYPLKKGRKL